ncbi:hypothetical protein ACTMUQ_32430 [Streptomyces sp. SD11]|uniref:hypothetical protein n=1 Tax=Streptomyces sp. SD11 TaxID=3452209 RepID=UPI003F8BCB63
MTAVHPAPVPALAPAPAPGPTPDPIEDLLADLQLERAGLPGRDPVPAARRARQVSGELADLGLSRFVAELLGESASVPAPAPMAVLDLEADEDGRRISYETWCAEARELTGEVWRWLSERRRAAGTSHGGDELPWWCGESAFPLPTDSVRRLAEVTAPVPDLSETAEAWARPTGLSGRATAEYNWRWLLLGKGLYGRRGGTLPPLNELITRLVGEARRHGLLPPGHRVRVLRRPNTPSMVMPVRLPGSSLLSLPTAVTPVTVQYLQHELAHLAEHALRPAGAPLAERWAFDPLRSEGWALLLEQLAGSTAFLARLGIDAEAAAALARFFAEEEHFSRGLMAADLALDTDLADCRTSAEALEAASAVASRTGLRWAPELLLLRQTRVLHWRSYLAGYAWRDTVRAELVARFGVDWAQRAEAWVLLRDALTRTGPVAGSAAGFLAATAALAAPDPPEPREPYASRSHEHEEARSR